MAATMACAGDSTASTPQLAQVPSTGQLVQVPLEGLPTPSRSPKYGPCNAASRANRRRGASPPEPERASSPVVAPRGRAMSPQAKQHAPTLLSTPSTAIQKPTLATPTPRKISFAADGEPAPASYERQPRPRTSPPETGGRRLPWDQQSGSPPRSSPSRPVSAQRDPRSEKSTRDSQQAKSVPATARARSQSTTKSKGPGDPFNLYRFVEPQKENDTFDRALGEIQNGRKSSCWMWYVIPSPPHMKNNIEKGSSLNRKYAIRSDEEAKAFLDFECDGIHLGTNYFDILAATCEHMRAGKAARSVIGSFDEPKLASSIIMFERITRGENKELHALLVEMAGLMDLQLEH
eukprot:gb/GFBE01065650.1/.p1 GENE.gb/GFBE01065650.1/~~gb/GFBE01065650.1/.p1  ORF type:complete len:348 (+),score=60.89 gb/GFBE01065650.1/:1-1044(+)